MNSTVPQPRPVTEDGESSSSPAKPPSPQGPGLPRLLHGSRRRYTFALVGVAFLQAVAAFIAARALHDGLRSGDGNGPRGFISWAPLALLATMTFATVALRVVEAGIAESFAQDYVQAVRRRLLKSLLFRPGDPTRPLRIGTALNRLVGDLGALRNWIRQGFARVISGSVIVLGLLASITILNPWVGVYSVIGLALLALLGRGIAGRLRQEIRASRSQRGRLANRVGDLVQIGPVARLFGRVDWELRGVAREGEALKRSQMRRAIGEGVLRRLPELSGGLMLVGILGIALGGGSRLGSFAAVNGATLFLHGLLVMTLRDLVGAWVYRLNFEEGRQRIAACLTEPSLRVRGAVVKLPRSRQPAALELRDIALPHTSLRLNLRVAAGERVWVIGPGGSGKTSLLRLLARVQDPTQGEIFLDGCPLHRLAPRALARTLQWVSPEVPLRRGTVRDNLRYGARTATDTELDQLARRCGLIGPSGVLPNGLETRVLGGGANLSSTARARVALARALAAKPRLLLIDEPVLLLDSGVRDLLPELLDPRRTTVVMVGGHAAPLFQPDQIWSLEPTPLTSQNATDSLSAEEPLREIRLTGS